MLRISVSKAFMATLELTWVIVQSVRYFCSVLTKFVIPRQIFINVPNIKFHENPPSRRHDGTFGQTDGQYEDNTRFSRYTKRLKCNTPNVRFSTGVSKSRMMFLVQTFFVTHCIIKRWILSEHFLKGCQFCGPKQSFRLS
jgi:hypothetical protein